MVLSEVLARMSPFAITHPVIQIAVGAVIGLFSQLVVTLDLQVCFLLFLPPLLFFDGWRLPPEDLFRALISLGLQNLAASQRQCPNPTPHQRIVADLHRRQQT